MSDTHGDVRRTSHAARLFRMCGVEVVFHCGDIGSPEVLTVLAAQLSAAGIAVHAVTGNVDCGQLEVLKNFPADSGVQVYGRYLEFEVAGKKLAILHGDDFTLLEALLSSGQFDYILTGHTHEPTMTQHRATRHINPGAVSRANASTVAILDAHTGKAVFLDTEAQSTKPE